MTNDHNIIGESSRTYLQLRKTGTSSQSLHKSLFQLNRHMAHHPYII